MSKLIKMGVPLKTPTQKIVTWSNGRSLYKNEFDEKEI
jgi:hypothetical protein